MVAGPKDFIRRLPKAELHLHEHAHVDPRIRLRHPDALGEDAETLRGETAPPRADERGHPRIVPAVDMALVHELDQPPFGENDVGQVEARELVLLRQRPRELTAVSQIFDDPIVERSMVLEFERADRMRDRFQRVGDAMRVIVEGVDAPFVPRTMMRCVPDAVDPGIAHVEVRARHVDLEPQDVRAIREFARPHAAEQIEIFGDGTVAIRATACQAP